MSVAAIEKAATSKGKLANRAKDILIAVRTEWRNGSGVTRSAWHILRDDPKKGVYERKNWIREHGVGTKRVQRPGTHWSLLLPPAPPMTRAEMLEEAERQFPTLSDGQLAQLKHLDEDKKLNATFYRLGEGLISSGSMGRNEMDDFLEFMHDENRRKVAAFDPEHPPKHIPEGKPGASKFATLETFIWWTLNQSIVDFLRRHKGDVYESGRKRVGIVVGKEDDDAMSKASEALMVEDGRATIAKLEFELDYKMLRSHLPSKSHRTVLDALLLEMTDEEIKKALDLTDYTLKYKRKAPIQNTACDFGFEPKSDEAFIDKMYAFRRKLARLRKEREAREKAKHDEEGVIL